MNQRERELRKKLRDDFPYYSKKNLKIRTKSEGVKPFVINEAQEIAHNEAESQLSARGYVRIIVLKGRQQGMSTYIQGRAYWKCTHNKGMRAFILTHEGDATSNLFGMTKRYHDNCNPLIKPVTDKDSGKELNFPKLDSGYKVATAGAKETGRSQTIQFFHGSEVAFWPNAQSHAAGVMEAIPEESGEVWLESTSDGVGNYFYSIWRDAVAGKNDFKALFIPWYIQSEYTSKVPEDFVKTPDEEEYCQLVKDYYDYDLSDGQLCFRRKKISKYGNEPEKFKREYPATPQEAFESAGHKQFIQGKYVNRAMANDHIQGVGPVTLGGDIARFGDDDTTIYKRQGRKVTRMFKGGQMGTIECAAQFKKILDNEWIDYCYIDLGYNPGVVDTLHDWGYTQVIGVNFGGSPLNPDKYTNKRNEMWGEYREWLMDEPVSLPDDECLELDTCAVQYKYDSKERKVLESKEQTKERLGKSPDDADGVVLTFAEPPRHREDEEGHQPRHDTGRSRRTGY